MEAPNGRIWFPQSPWPGGHAVTEFRWSGRLDADGALWFDLHLESESYDAGAEPEFDEEESTWRSAAAWQNFGNCTLSSTEWREDGSTGILVGSGAAPLEWSLIGEREFRADEAAEGSQVDPSHPPAFMVYLLGHDAVADHRVRFRAGEEPGVFDVEWHGRVALAYSGDFALRHAFVARIPGVRFEGFAPDPGLSEDRARALLRASLRGA